MGIERYTCKGPSCWCMSMIYYTFSVPLNRLSMHKDFVARFTKICKSGVIEMIQQWTIVPPTGANLFDELTGTTWPTVYLHICGINMNHFQSIASSSFAFSCLDSRVWFFLLFDMWDLRLRVEDQPGENSCKMTTHKFWICLNCDVVTMCRMNIQWEIDMQL